MNRRPHGMLFDYGGTLVDEVSFDTRAGIDVLLAHAKTRPAPAIVAALLERADRVSREVADRRDAFQVETPWASLTRLIHSPFGIQFTRPLADLELLFWNACATTRAMPGALDALAEFHRAGIPMGLVSNSSFGATVLQHELAKHSLSSALSVVVVSAEYAVRKPNPLLFDAAASLLGVPCDRIWFVGDRLDTDVAGAEAVGMRAILYAAAGRDGGQDGPASASLSWPEIVALFRTTRD